MIARALRPEIRLARLGAVVAALALAVVLTPAEASLGGLLRAVYLHGALLRASEAAFAGAGIAGLAFLLTKSDAAWGWSWAFLRVAAVGWLASFLVSGYVTVAAWGGINWAEPRLLASGRVLVAAALSLALALVYDSHRLKAAIAIVLAAFVAFQVTSAGLMLHPDNPIASSSSGELRVHYLVVVGLALALMLEATSWLLPSRLPKGH